jgi:hypothetical protein
MSAVPFVHLAQGGDKEGRDRDPSSGFGPDPAYC